MADPTSGDTTAEADDGGLIAHPRISDLDRPLRDLVELVNHKNGKLTDVPIDDYRYPDADEAAEYFDTAAQASKIEVGVKHAGLEAIVAGEAGYRWRISTEWPVVAAPIGQLIDVPKGIYIADDSGQRITAEVVGTFEDHSRVYEVAAELMENIAEAEASQEEIAGDAIWEMRQMRLAENRPAGPEADSA